jgi:uncharacterized membrane protein
MTLEPLLTATPLIQLHSVAATGALVLGLIQFTAPKGTIPHRAAGWTWFALVVVMLTTAFVNHDILQWGPFSTKLCCGLDASCARGSYRCASIHLVSISVLLMLPFAVVHARRHDVTSHRGAMLTLYLGFLTLGAIFTLLPHRTLHAVVFGP